MRVGLADMISFSALSMYMSRTGSWFGGGHQVLFSRKGLGLNTLEKPNVAFANDSLNTGKLQIFLITPALKQQYLRISTCLRTPSRTCYLSL